MRTQLLRDAAERSIQYLAGLDERRVSPAIEAIESLREIDAQMPEGPGNDATILSVLDNVGSPATVASAGPRFFGFVVGGALPVTVAAHWLATA